MNAELIEMPNSRVLRGGCWYNIARNCRSTFRYVVNFGFHNSGIGFRVVKSKRLRVLRGGAFSRNRDYVRLAYRNSDIPWFRSNNVGFRTVRGEASGSLKPMDGLPNDPD